MPLHANLPLRCMELSIGPASAASATVIYLHGMGATLEDMVSLVDEMQFPGRHLLLDGAFPVNLGAHYTGRSWYRRDGPDMEGLDDSVNLIRATLNALQVDARRTVVVGFSQGAAVALATVLASETPPAGLCLLSGYLPVRGAVAAGRPRVQDLYVLMVHGLHDEVVALKDGLAALDTLASQGARARLVVLPSGHWIAGEAVVELKRFLQERLGR